MAEGLWRFGPGKMLPRHQLDLVDFIFPLHEFVDPYVRSKEIELYMDYAEQSTVFIYFQQSKIIGTVRIIFKKTEEEFLPIEFSKVTEIKSESPFDLKLGDNFSIPKNLLTMLEIGGLRIINSPLKEKYSIIKQLFDACVQEGKNGQALITCTPVLASLYVKYFFKEIATVTYDSKTFWSALYKKQLPMK